MKAQQRFRPDAAVIFNIDNRLVVQAQLAAAQSPLQHPPAVSLAAQYAAAGSELPPAAPALPADYRY
jgi:hypothetical protein